MVVWFCGALQLCAPQLREKVIAHHQNKTRTPDNQWFMHAMSYTLTSKWDTWEYPLNTYLTKKGVVSICFIEFIKTDNSCLAFPHQSVLIHRSIQDMFVARDNLLQQLTARIFLSIWKPWLYTSTESDDHKIKINQLTYQLISNVL